MRQVVLDTETTGLEPSQGHRIIELGCVELVNRRVTERHFHQYIRPDREIEAGALEVHGITNEFLKDKPRFASIAQDFIAFIDGAEVIIHNAPFDVGFINHELSLSGEARGRLEDHCTIVDTLELARQLHPGQKNSLDALCKRYAVDNSQRTRHGALLDAEILADVYLSMTGGQATLALGGEETPVIGESRSSQRRRMIEHPPLRIIRASPQEIEAHVKRLEAIDVVSKGQCIWKRLECIEADDVRHARDTNLNEVAQL